MEPLKKQAKTNHAASSAFSGAGGSLRCLARGQFSAGAILAHAHSASHAIAKASSSRSQTPRLKGRKGSRANG